MSFSGLSSSSIELLESRIAPAGVVTLDIDKSGYLLTGDALSNDILITKDGSLITLTPRNGTQILDKASGSSTPVNTPISLAIFSSQIDINMGGGADLLSLQDLTLLGNLRVDSGATSATPGDADVVEISNLRVAGDLTLNARSGTWTVGGEDFYVGGNANITSKAQVFDLNVSSFFVGDELTIDALIAKASDRFQVRADTFIVFNDFVVTPSVSADHPEGQSMLMVARNVFNVGRLFHVINGQNGTAALGVGAGVLDIGGELSVENQSKDGELNFGVLVEDALRIHQGVEVTSRSTGLTAVDIEAGLVRIDSAVSARFSKGDGLLAIVSDNLLIKGNVSFAAKETGTLQLEGAGDVFGKISASLGNGAGVVTIKGRDVDQLFVDALNVTTPAKLPTTAGGANITLEDVRVFGKLGLRLGSGSDTININNGDFLGLTSISTGSGDDKVNLHTAGTYDASFAGVKVMLGGGNDTLTLGMPGAPTDQGVPNVTIFQLAVFDGGSGTDSYLIDGRKVSFKKLGADRLPVDFSPRIRNFEPQTT